MIKNIIYGLLTCWIIDPLAPLELAVSSSLFWGRGKMSPLQQGEWEEETLPWPLCSDFLRPPWRPGTAETRQTPGSTNTLFQWPWTRSAHIHTTKSLSTETRVAPPADPCLLPFSSPFPSARLLWIRAQTDRGAPRKLDQSSSLLLLSNTVDCLLCLLHYATGNLFRQ